MFLLSYNWQSFKAALKKIVLVLKFQYLWETAEIMKLQQNCTFIKYQNKPILSHSIYMDSLVNLYPLNFRISLWNIKMWIRISIWKISIWNSFGDTTALDSKCWVINFIWWSVLFGDQHKKSSWNSKTSSIARSQLSYLLKLQF